MAIDVPERQPLVCRATVRFGPPPENRVKPGGPEVLSHRDRKQLANMEARLRSDDPVLDRTLSGRRADQSARVWWEYTGLAGLTVILGALGNIGILVLVGILGLFGTLVWGLLLLGRAGCTDGNPMHDDEAY